MSEKPVVFLGMPGYGHMQAGAARGFYRATAGGLRSMQAYKSGSLLAQNFNALWCAALTTTHRGNRVDYFAMQHDDIAPDDFWLDTLVAELESNELDVLGVVVPIKDPKGLSSVALDDTDGDDWNPKCRLTMREVYDLPETFTQADVGFPLLLNTGLWVCRFDPEWAKQVHFTIRDRIVFSEQDDCFKAQVESEDWFFSRRCNELGLKIGATRKVGCEHAGHFEFTNTRAWGEYEYDQEMLAEPLVRPVAVRGDYAIA